MTNYKYYLSLDELNNISNILDDTIAFDYGKHLKYINSNKEARRVFIDLCGGVDDFLNRRNKEIDYNNKSIQRQIDRCNKQIYQIQTGGNNAATTLSIVCSIFGGTAITALVAYYVYKWFKRPICKEIYPLVEMKEDVSVTDLIFRLVPKEWLAGLEDKKATDIVAIVTETINSIRNTLSFLEDNTLVKRIAVGIGRAVASAISVAITAAGSAGTVPDQTLVNLIFNIKSGIEILAKILDALLHMADDKLALRFLYDILNINFNDGSFGVKCWVNYILKSYGKQSVTYGIICNFVKKILDKLAKFVGDTLETFSRAPTLGILSEITRFIIQKVKEHAFDIAIQFLDQKYSEISPHDQSLIQDPEKMEKYINSQADRFGFLLIYKKDQIIRTIKDNSHAFGTFVNQSFSLMYASLYLLKECEQYTGPAIETLATPIYSKVKEIDFSSFGPLKEAQERLEKKTLEEKETETEKQKEA